MKSKLASMILAASAACAAVPGGAQAAYPDQPIRLVIGYAAGGTTDILARALGEQLGKSLNQSVIIENKPGAAGNLAASYVACQAGRLYPVHGHGREPRHQPGAVQEPGL